jgi:hypothetical protein
LTNSYIYNILKILLNKKHEIGRKGRYGYEKTI